MPPIGETLREARMRQKLDIADVEERTKIRAKYLRALENEEWGLLPGPTFVRTFLRTYAAVLGLDPHLLVEQYKADDVPPNGNDYEFQPLTAAASGSRRRPRQGGSERPGPGRLLIGIGLAFIVFLLLLGLLGGGDDEPDTGGPAGTATTPRAAPSQQTTPEAKQPRPAGVTVRITPTEPTYACIDSGPGTEVAYEGTLDSPRQFRDPRLVRLNLGKRSVTVTVNGEPVTIVESPEPLGLALRAGGSREISEGERPCA